MPEDGSKLCNVAVLADEARQVELAVPLARLDRIAPQLTSTEGMADGSGGAGSRYRVASSPK